MSDTEREPGGLRCPECGSSDLSRVQPDWRERILQILQMTTRTYQCQGCQRRFKIDLSAAKARQDPRQ